MKPEVRLNIWTHHTGEIYGLLESRIIDISYVYSLRRFPDILAEPVFTESMVVLCHKNSGFPEEVTPYLKNRCTILS